jgi:MFS family permease
LKTNLTKKNAIWFVVLLGIVSLFADITYEGARSITGQYLAVLGASGTVVGIVSGFGELIGYGFRFISGYISDKTKKYWLITFTGYALNLIAVPLLALAGNWPMAAGLIILERLGKAIRNPSRDAMLSYATKEIGRGWGFGLHEAMDQIGALLGPLVVSAVLYYKGTYQMSFAILLIPAICALIVLAVGRYLYPRPQDLEVNTQEINTKGFSKKYWLYIAAVSCVAAGYIDFSLIAYHFEKMSVIPTVWIPVFFSIAMAADGIAALIFGRLYDTKGISILIVSTIISSFFAPLVFIDGFYFALFGMILWGIGLGSQESIMRAVVANLVQMDKRGTAYGTLNMGFGISWFLGSALMGFLYDVSILSLIVFSMGIQLAAIPILITVKNSNQG